MHRRAAPLFVIAATVALSAALFWAALFWAALCWPGARQWFLGHEAERQSASPSPPASEGPHLEGRAAHAPSGKTAPVAPPVVPGLRTHFIGTVTDAAGRPLEGVKVTVYGEDRATPVVTRADGRFEIPLEGRDDVCLRAAAPGLVTTEGGIWAYRGYVTKMTLVTACEIRVRVTEAASGLPVASARVRSICGDDVTTDADFVRRARHTSDARTDAEGHAIVLAAEGVTRIYVDAPGFAPMAATTFYCKSSGHDIAIEVRRGGVVAGTIIDPDGDPVVGAKVHAIARPTYDRFVETDKSGAFRFVDVPNEGAAEGDSLLRRVGLSVRTKQWAPHAWLVRAPQPDETRVTKAHLRPARTLEGRAVHPDGRPAAGIKIHLEPQSLEWFVVERMGDAPAVAVSDAQGHFRLAPAPSGKVGLMGYGTTSFFASLDVVIPAEGPVPSVTLREERSGDRTLAVRVLDAEGNPVGEAWIEVSHAGPDGGHLGAGESDGRGRLEVTGLPAKELDIKAHKEGFAETTVKVRLAAEQHTTVEVRFPSGRASGRIVTRDGSPAQIEVRLMRWMADGSGSWSYPDLKTDKEGRVRFRGLGNDKFFLKSASSGMVVMHGPRRFGAGDEGLEWTVATQAEADALRGLIELIDAQGKHIERAQIAIGSASGALCECVDGKPWLYRTPGLAPGAQELHVRVDGFLPVHVSGVAVAAGSNPTVVRLALSRGAVIEGRITDRKGRPFADVEIRAEQQAAYTDEEGRYFLGGLGGGTHRLRLDGPEMLPTERVVKMGSNERRHVDIEVDGAGSIQIDASKAPKDVPASRIEVRSAEPGNPWVGRSGFIVGSYEGENYTFASIESLAPGRYEVTILWDGKRLAPVEVDVVALETATVRFDAP